ncbi:hypothetical protein NHX12_005085 [Muraenolepis orangiensis]|uniref:IRG-type G domain-containing protein n=1 Tax=Muraenolepis orangiensis TaxID=630683 RepID=A0A9Q0ICU7_9TELE|nr:hypothetical protein NHX12_005085 [Muraenolepis orangiensis]
MSLGTKVTEDIETALKNDGTHAAALIARKYLKDIDSIPLNIAVTGESGSGKSTFVNAFRGIGHEDESAAETGVTETTMETKAYSHPILPNVTVWDLPGIGTTKFPAKKYLQHIGFEKFDFFIIVSSDRFRENDVMLAQAIKKMDKTFYFVRAKIDSNLDSAKKSQKNHDEEKTLQKIKENCIQGLEEQGVTAPQVFLVSSFDLHLYNFPTLQETMERDLPSHKRDTLILALPNISQSIIKKKKEIFCSQISAVSKRLCTYLAENTYIDTSVQKGGISMPGCLEHTGVVTQLIREARENKGNLSVLWLDLENAFSSIPHKLVQFTLTKHHVPSRCRDLIADYYSNFRMKVSSGAITSSWQKVEIGIITGCTISVTLFSLAMNMLTKSAEPECRGPRTNSGQRQPPIRAFMDDLTVMTESVPGCRWILKGLEELVEWARMRFKPAKSRSMVLRKGKVVDKFRFNIADTAIPSISEKPVKSLGKVFDCSLRDTTSIQSTCTELDGWLKSVDKSGLPGKFKAWVYQHGILPRILWPLLVYAVPISTVETLERRIGPFVFKVFITE